MSTLIGQPVNTAIRLRRLRRAMSTSNAVKLTRADSAKREFRVYLRSIGRFVYLRGGTTDSKCLEKVFVDNEYKLPFEVQPQLIVDAGANIGMATLYFAHRYPHALIFSVEPDKGNFELLQRNCEGLANVTLFRGAIWPQICELEIADPTAEGWKVTVSERSTDTGGVAVSAITVPEILKRTAARKIDLFKIDIECAELKLFSIGAEEWIDRVTVIAIELHDRFLPGCAQAFYSALIGRNFIQESIGENIFVKLLTQSAAAKD